MAVYNYAIPLSGTGAMNPCMIEFNSVPANLTVHGSLWVAYEPVWATVTTSGTAGTTGPSCQIRGNYFTPTMIATVSTNSSNCICVRWQHNIVWDYDPAMCRRNRLQEIIRRRSAPAVIGSRHPAAVGFDQREEMARRTLRRVVGDDQYRRFLKQGFISLKARSGDVYLIYPDHIRTRVFRNGREVEQLCVVLTADFPPTDSLITRYLMLLNDEREFLRIAIKTRPAPAARRAVPFPGQTLVEETAGIRRTG
jgi:hypothetical protein